MFNIAHFKDKRKICQTIAKEILFADDIALVAHDTEGTQRLVDRFSLAAEQFSLKTSIKNTECLFQSVKSQTIAQTPIDIHLPNENLAQTKSFVYLGSPISDNARLDSELNLRMGRASSAYLNLKERL